MIFTGCPVFNQDLKDFKFIVIEPDSVAGQTFVDGENILVTVRTGEHGMSAPRAFQTFFDTVFPPQTRIVDDLALKHGGLVSLILCKSRFPAGNQAIHGRYGNETATAAPAGLNPHAFIENVMEKLSTSRT